MARRPVSRQGSSSTSKRAGRGSLPRRNCPATVLSSSLPFRPGDRLALREKPGCRKLLELKKRARHCAKGGARLVQVEMGRIGTGDSRRSHSTLFENSLKNL